jgi:hypothetical protein
MEATTFSNGVRVINCTAYSVQFIDDGKLIIVPPSGMVLTADIKIEEIDKHLETEVLMGNVDGWKIVDRIHEELPDVYILGTSKASIAYNSPEQPVVYPKPLAGFQGIVPKLRKFDTNKFRVG